MNSRLLPVMVSAIFLMELIDPSRIWIILLIAFGGVWMLAFVWARSLARGLSLRRQMRFGWVQVGDRLEERFGLENSRGFPAIWLEVRDQSTLPGYQASRVTGIESVTSREWHTQGICSRRGLYLLGPASLHTGDPFGIYSVAIEDDASRTMMVMPPIVPLPTIEVAPGGRSGEGRPRTDAPEPSVSSSSVREYIPGESLRNIHWRTSARRNQLFVRIFDGTPTGDWYILLDLDQQVQVGEGFDSTEEHSIILAASLSDQGLRLRRAVGLIASSKDTIWIPPRRSEYQRWKILRALATADTGELSLGDLLKRVEPELHARTSLVIITASMAPDWMERLLPIMWRGVIPTVLLLDPASFETGAEKRIGVSRGHTENLLRDFGVHAYTIDRSLLNTPEAHPGQSGQWEWRVSTRGRAIPIRKPENLEWKQLG